MEFIISCNNLELESTNVWLMESSRQKEKWAAPQVSLKKVAPYHVYRPNSNFEEDKTYVYFE